MAKRIARNLTKDDMKPLYDDFDNVIKLFEDHGHWNRGHIHHPKTGKVIMDGESCGHPGCLSHITHPCEVCERKGGISECSD